MQTIIKIKAMLLIISNFYLKMNNYDLFKITPTFYPQIDRYAKYSEYVCIGSSTNVIGEDV